MGRVNGGGRREVDWGYLKLMVMSFKGGWYQSEQPGRVDAELCAVVIRQQPR